MDGSTALILGIITGPIGLALFVRFGLWNGAWWLARRLRDKRFDPNHDDGHTAPAEELDA